MLLKPKKLTLSCTVCEGTMDHFLTIPAVSRLPEILRYRCRTCGAYKTVESGVFVPQERKAGEVAA